MYIIPDIPQVASESNVVVFPICASLTPPGPGEKLQSLQ